MTRLDWSGSDGIAHWGGGPLRPCRSCQQPALLLDDNGIPQHKTCAEQEAGLAPAAAGSAPAAALTEPETTLAGPEAEVLW